MLLSRRMPLSLGLAAVAVLATGHGQPRAETLEVTATVPDACTVQGGTLAFGTVDPSGGDVTGSGQIDINCNSAANVAIALDAGLHPGQGTNGRAMKSASSEDYLDYKLYTEGLGTQRTPGLAIAVSGGLTSGSNTVVVDGIIDGGQSVPGGDYSDTVQITLTFE